MQTVIEDITRLTLFTNIFLFVGLPAGSFDYVKLPFVGFLLLMTLLLSNRMVVDRTLLALLLSAVMFISCSLLYVLVTGRFDLDALVEYRSFVLMLVIISTMLLHYKSGIYDYNRFLKAMLSGSVLYVVLKLSLIAFIFFFPGSLAIIQKTVSEDLVPMGSVGMEGLERFVSINDYLILFMFFYVDGTGAGRITRYLLKFVFLVSLLLSFARYIWLAFALLFMADCFVKRRYFSIVAIPLALVISLLLVNEFTDVKILDAISNRTGAEGALSTSVKREQAGILLNEIADYPVLGKGIGTYVEHYIRNDRLKYGYEVFVLLVIMQFGVVIAGTVFTLSIIPFIRWMALNNFTVSRLSLFTLLSFVVYMASALTNPVILSATSAFLISFFYINGDYEFRSTRQKLCLRNSGIL